jgi:tetratricopeptide (TPR) repeat protein/tRNA A-37 threonylcarbamoyl transferase component Bud32/TolB-like protein
VDDASVGPYRVIDRLGAGGMGEVFLATDTRLNRKVALKYLSDPALDLPRARERLLREARAAAQISHPNIAAIYDILDTGTHPCIVMEYAQGETLAQVSAKGPMPSEQAVSIGAQLADALAHAHAAGVVHRDLKPANVVLTAGGTVKILDFGVARVLDIEEELAGDERTREVTIQSHAGKIAGTPAYMAPEQLAGRPASPLTDIYSLGVTLFELLTARRPFGGKTTSDLVYQMMSSPTPLASASNGAVPPALDAIVAKAMAREPEQRYRSAADMAADLRRVERTASRDAGVTTAETVEVERRLAARRRRRTIATVAACAGVVALAAWAYTAWRREPAPPLSGSVPIAVLPFTSNQHSPEAVKAGLGFTESVVAALEGLSSITVLSRPDFSNYVADAPDRVKGAGELGVAAVVSGEVTITDSSREFAVRVQQPDGKVLLKRTYQGRPTEVSALERGAAADIVAALNVNVTAADRDRLRRVPACRDDAYGDYVEGRSLLDRKDVPGNRAKAEQAFSRAVAKDARCAPAFLGLADALWSAYKDEGPDPALVERARQALDSAAALDPDSPSIKRAYAVLYLGTGRPEQAEKVMLDVIERRPFDDEPYRLRAEILGRQGRTEEATAALQQAIRLRPSNASNYISLGNSHFWEGRYPEAIQTYIRGLEIQPDNVWLKSNLAAAYSYNGEPRKAIAVYESVPDLDATMLSNLSMLYFDEGRYTEAADLLQRALALEPRSAIKHGNLGDTYRKLGRTKEAEGEYRRAAELTAEQIKVDDRDATALARHAVFDAKLGDASQALQHIRRAVEITPDDNTVLYKRAVVHALLKQRNEAVEWLKKAIEKGYSRARARTDPDLDSIRKVPQVEAMLRRD